MTQTQTQTQNVSIASSFSKFPAGRFKTDGPHSGEQFRDDVLLPLLKANTPVLVKLDGTLGYGSSFLEEAFGGLVRVHGFSPSQLRSLLKIETSDKSIELEIWRYIDEAGGTKSKK